DGHQRLLGAPRRRPNFYRAVDQQVQGVTALARAKNDLSRREVVFLEVGDQRCPFGPGESRQQWIVGNRGSHAQATARRRRGGRGWAPYMSLLLGRGIRPGAFCRRARGWRGSVAQKPSALLRKA